MKIKAYTEYNEDTNTHFYNFFEVIEKFPKVGDEYRDRKIVAIHEIGLDSEQGNDSVYNYQYYRIRTEDEDGEMDEDFVAIELKNCYSYYIMLNDGIYNYGNDINLLKKEMQEDGIEEYEIFNSLNNELIFKL